jgi:protein required for attachment to host cells
MAGHDEVVPASKQLDLGQTPARKPRLSLAASGKEYDMTTEKLAIKPGEWIVVCDGGKALVLENTGDEKFPNLKTRETLAHDNPKTHEQGTDVPGRTHSSVGPGRSAVGQTDWHDQAEQAFLDNLAGYLARAVEAHQARSIVMVASPRALGMIRPAYTHGLKAAVRAEIPKDLVKLPVYEIEKHLAG